MQGTREESGRRGLAAGPGSPRSAVRELRRGADALSAGEHLGVGVAGRSVLRGAERRRRPSTPALLAGVGHLRVAAGEPRTGEGSLPARHLGCAQLPERRRHLRGPVRPRMSAVRGRVGCRRGVVWRSASETWTRRGRCSSTASRWIRATRRCGLPGSSSRRTQGTCTGPTNCETTRRRNASRSRCRRTSAR